MFTSLRHNLVNSGTTLVSEFCNIFNMQNIFGNMANCAAAYIPPAAASFDGGNNYFRWQTNPPFGADSNLVSAVIRVSQDADALNTLFTNNGSRLQAFVGGTGILTFNIRDSTGTLIFNQHASTFDFTGLGLTTLLLSINTTTQVFQLYDTDGNDYSGTPTWNNTNQIDLTLTRFDIGANAGATAGSFWDGCIGPVWFTKDEAIDWSNSANRDLVGSGATLNDPGADGSNWSPTSTQPEIFIEDLTTTTNAGSQGDPDLGVPPTGTC